MITLYSWESMWRIVCEIKSQWPIIRTLLQTTFIRDQPSWSTWDCVVNHIWFLKRVSVSPEVFVITLKRAVILSLIIGSWIATFVVRFRFFLQFHIAFPVQCDAKLQVWWRLYKFLGDEEAADEDGADSLEAARNTRRLNSIGEASFKFTHTNLLFRKRRMYTTALENYARSSLWNWHRKRARAKWSFARIRLPSTRVRWTASFLRANASLIDLIRAEMKSSLCLSIPNHIISWQSDFVDKESI